MSKWGNLLLGLLAGGLVALAASLVAFDLVRTARREERKREAQRIAEADLAVVGKVEEGWFPPRKQPIFSWDEDEEGWLMEAGAPLALGAAAPSVRTPPEPSGTPEPNQAPAIPKGAKQNAARKPEPPCLRVSARYRSGKKSKKSLAVPVHFPDPATIFRGAMVLSGVRFIAYDVYVPAEVKGYVGCLFFLKDKDGLWFQARSRAALTPGRWTTLTADLRGASPDVEPLGHLGQWDENQASQVRTIGITFYGEAPYKGRVYLDNFRGWMRPRRFEHLVERLEAETDGGGGRSERNLTPERRTFLASLLPQAQRHKPDPLMILNLRTDPPASADADGAPQMPSVGRYRTFTVRFELNRQPYNPFDIRRADVWATLHSPSGKTKQLAGFWYQDYERRARFASDEFIPVGRPEWRVRVTPLAVGRHTLTLHAVLNRGQPGEESVTSAPMRFEARPSGEKGFVRVSRKDPNYFEFSNGAFFYPLGHNTHSPVDLRCWDRIFKKPPPLFRGLRLYEDFFPKMAAAGETVGEVWMSSWWLGIEWTRRWRHYHGAGRYNLQHAWKLDRVLELARRHGIRLHLVIDNHGKFSEWCDAEWNQNPYNRAREGRGPVLRSSEFFTNAEARRLHRQRLRYIAARWASDPAILGWELVSEYDLIGDKDRNRRHFYKTEPARAWAREMVQALKAGDPYGHPVTIHYATDYNYVDRTLSRTPLFDYITGDAYRRAPGYASMAVATARAFAAAKKPFWITEFGGDWNATSIPRLEADLHCGLWSTWMTPAVGTPLFWWYDFIDQRGLYSEYRSFANFIRGEDRRGLRGRTQWLSVASPSGKLNGLQYRWPQGAYAWVYSDRAMREMPEPARRERFRDVQTRVSGLQAGRYRIEFWDTYRGQIVSAQSAELKSGAALSLRFPPFVNDMAVKIKMLQSGGKGR